METTDNSKYLMPIAVIGAGVLIAGAVLWNGSRVPGGQPDAAPGAGMAVDVKDVKTEGAPFIGKADAPVTIAYWSDFQCSFCKNFDIGTLPDIIEEYVETGKVKIVFFDFPFLGQHSIDAAMYSRAIWKLYPEQYFAWREALYAAQDQSGDQGFGDAASIDALNAKIAGLDAAKIAADVKTNGDAYRAAAEADRSQGQKFGVNSTPSFIIGKQSIVGAQPYANFKSAIEKAL